MAVFGPDGAGAVDGALDAPADGLVDAGAGVVAGAHAAAIKLRASSRTMVRREDTGTSEGLGQRAPTSRRSTRTTMRYSTIPTSAIVRSVANMSGISKSEPRARLMRTPRPRSAPAHSPTIAPTTARVTPTRI